MADSTDDLPMLERFRLKALEKHMRRQGRSLDNPEDLAWLRETSILNKLEPPVPSPRPPIEPRGESKKPKKPKKIGVGRGGYRHGVPGGGKTKEKVIRPEGTNSVYLCYDAQDRLLYVGITARGVWRNRQHSYRSTWWPQMVRQEWEHFVTRYEAICRENELIATLNPIYNIIRPTGRKI